MKWLVASIAFLAFPAVAQEWIDYELVMQEGGDRVKASVDSEGRMLRNLTRTDGVSVQCVDADCIALDPQGATGCAYNLLLTLNELAGLCPAEISPEQGRVLAENFALMSGYIQKNAVPPRSSGFIDELVRGRREVLEGLDKAQICPRLLPPDGDLSAILLHMSGPKMQPVITELLEHPRLPVINPCL